MKITRSGTEAPSKTREKTKSMYISDLPELDSVSVVHSIIFNEGIMTYQNRLWRREHHGECGRRNGLRLFVTFRFFSLYSLNLWLPNKGSRIRFTIRKESTAIGRQKSFETSR